MAGPRVLLVDDHALFRDGLSRLLNAWGFVVVGEAGDGEEALERARRLRPDLVLMDIDMPKLNGIEATRILRTELPDTKVVMLTASDTSDHLFEAVKSGADGYILKSTGGEELRHLLGGLTQGEPAMFPGLAKRLLHEFARGPAPAHTENPDALTPREQEVLEEVSMGRTNREVGAKLFVSEETVKYHLKNIMQKLHLRNRAEVVAWAIRHEKYRSEG